MAAFSRSIASSGNDFEHGPKLSASRPVWVNECCERYVSAFAGKVDCFRHLMIVRRVLRRISNCRSDLTLLCLKTADWNSAIGLAP